MNDLEAIYKGLSEQVLLLSQRWSHFQQLFLSDREIIDLLNMTAPSFFSFHQDVVINEIILRIARLLDPANQRNHKNLSMELLYNAVHDEMIDNVTLAEFAVAYKNFQKHKAAIDEYRNKKLAHTDYDRAGIRISPGTVKEIRDTIAALQHCMKIVHAYLYNCDIHYEEIILPLDDINSLLHHLQLALSAKGKS